MIINNLKWFHMSNFLKDFFEDTNKLCYIFLVLVLLCITALVCWNANWTVGDDFQFITTTAIGRPSHANTFEGRFWPLGLCDYSILLFIPCGNTPLAHFIYNSIIMSAAVLLFFNSLTKITNSASIALFTTIVLIFYSAFFRLHLQCIFSEIIIFFMLSVFMFCFFLRREKSFGFQFGAWLSATYAIFCKEPMFGLFLVFSVAGLLFYRKKPYDIALYCSIIFSSISYIAIYLYRLLFRVTVDRSYGDTFETSKNLAYIFNTFILQIGNEPILLLLFVVCSIRLSQMIKNRKVEFADILALSGWSYIFAYTLLGAPFTAAYYCFPALAFIYPVFALIIKESDWKSLNKFSIGVVCCITCVCIYSVKYFQTNLNEIKTTFYNRKHDMPLVNALAQKLCEGEKIVFISNANKCAEKDKAATIRLETFLTEMWNHFLTFTIGYKINQENGAKLQDNIPNEKCIVISNGSDYPNLHCIRTNCYGCNVFEYEPKPGE